MHHCLLAVRFMVFLPLVVRGIGAAGFEGILTDSDVKLVYEDLSAYRLVLFGQKWTVYMSQ